MSKSSELPQFLSEHYPGLTLGAALFYRWPVGIRFDLHGQVGGVSEIMKRAVLLYEACFRKSDDCIVVSQDWHSDSKPVGRRLQSLWQFGKNEAITFKAQPDAFETCADPDDNDAPEFTLSWVVQPAHSFQYKLVLEGIANSDFAFEPSVSSWVFFCNVDSGLVFHMYDDRGTDVIAPSPDTIRSLYTDFNGWILADDRKRIEAVFG